MRGPGIYAIRNAISGRIYVGSAGNIQQRWRSHLCLLRDGRHHSVKLQRSWNIHGETAFEWTVLELVPDHARLIEREQFWIDHLRAAGQRTGFNVAPRAGSRRGLKSGPEATTKRLATLAARSPEEKAASSARRSAARIGYKHTPETLAKMRGQKRRDETKRRIAESQRGRQISGEHRAKIAATLTGRKTGPQSSETIAKRVAATRATKEARRAAA